MEETQLSLLAYLHAFLTKNITTPVALSGIEWTCLGSARWTVQVISPLVIIAHTTKFLGFGVLQSVQLPFESF